MASHFDTTKHYRACDGLLSKPDGSEVMAYDPRSMKVHELNESLAFVFGLCDGKNSCEELVIEVMQRYDLDAETASRETYRALKILTDDELIEPQ